MAARTTWTATRRWPALGFAVVLGALVLLTSPASAQDLPRLSDEITDEVGVLAGEESRVREALAEIRERDGVQLFALFTDTTGERAVTGFVDEVAAANSLGGNDALLVVAMSDRTYAMWVSDALTGVSDADIDSILVDDVEPRLAAGEFPDAVIAAAEGLGRAAAAPSGEEPATVRGDGGLLAALLLILAGVLLIGFVVAGRIKDRRGRRRAAEEHDRRTRQLAREANALLLACDEAVREAEQELDFAEAQFRAADVEPYRVVLAEVRDELHAAFAVRQRLDDDIPDTPEERVAMLNEIIERTKRVDALLTAEHDRLAELRDLERNAAVVLADVSGQVDAVASRTEEAEGLLESLRKVAARSSESVDGNLAESRKAITAAHDAASAAQEALDRDDPRTAANRIRDAQEAHAQAATLVAAVERLAADATQAEQNLDAELRAAAANVDAAAAALADDRVRGLESQVAEARALLEQARSEEAAGEPDVIEAYRLATRASVAADGVLAEVREAEEKRARERTAAEKALRSAEAMYARAADYLATRRRGVGHEARTRLQESERHLVHARSLLEEAARESAEEAKTAERQAEEAYRLAQRDFDNFDRYQGPFGHGPFGGGWGRRGPTIVIGGIPIPIGGSPRGGGGRGGSTWGSPGGGRSSGGGFGGGRSRGGGFGGGRSRGGRF